MKTADLVTMTSPKTAQRAIKFLLAYMRKEGATTRAKAISYEKIEESHALNMGKPGFGYHSYAGYYSDGVPVWDESKLLVRRSHSQGKEVIDTTKQKVKYKIHLPKEVMDVLRWHVETQLVTPEMEESDLLFPSVTGGFRAPSTLNKPFADVAEAIELGKQFTQRGLRRTFNDLARAAEIESLVTRSISGHLTERMQHHYSTVNAAEQRASIGKVIDLMKVREERKAAAQAADASEGTAGGAPGGAPQSGSGAPKEKAG